jgi:hypothetical protein
LVNYSAPHIAPLFAVITTLLAAVLAVIATFLAAFQAVFAPFFAAFHPRRLSLSFRNGQDRGRQCHP